MSQPNIVLTPNAPASAGTFYDIAGEYPHQPLQNLFLWINYPWFFSGGVGRIPMQNNPVVPPLGQPVGG